MMMIGSFKGDIHMKVIFLDIDGTLVDYEGKMPKSAMKAVQEARKNGHKIYLTTGRSKAEVYQYLWDIGFDGMIGGNGMYIEDNGLVIQDLAMSKEMTVRTVHWMNENDIGFYLESKNGLFGSDNFFSKASFLYGEDSEENRKKVNDLFPEMIFDGEMKRDDVAKISFCLNPDKLEEAKKEFQDELKIGSWSLTGKKQEFGEFAINGVDKVNAVHILLEHLKAGLEDTFAFGDADSDLQMVKHCNVGVAMGNATDNLKEVADYVTEDVTNHGLWNAFRKYGIA